MKIRKFVPFLRAFRKRGPTAAGVISHNSRPEHDFLLNFTSAPHLYHVPFSFCIFSPVPPRRDDEIRHVHAKLITYLIWHSPYSFTFNCQTLAERRFRLDLFAFSLLSSWKQLSYPAFRSLRNEDLIYIRNHMTTHPTRLLANPEIQFLGAFWQKLFVAHPTSLWEQK